MPALLATDLDRTLIYSAAALALPMPDRQAPTLLCVEVLDGRPQSFLTVNAAETLRQLGSRASVVPITTRTLAQYARVRLPGLRPDYAITSNGGHLLVDGRSDPGWHEQVLHSLRDEAAPLPAVVAELAGRATGDWVRKRRVGDDLFCYLVVDLLALPDDFVADWRRWCADRGWQVSQQGRKIYAIPVPLSKERALREVAGRVGATRVLAAGDGLLDAGFLMSADVGIRPPHGELAALGWTHPTVRVADRPGVLAADDITTWFAAELAAD